MSDLLNTPKSSPMMDKQSCLVMAVMLAAFFAYQFFYLVPAQQEYQKDLVVFYQEHPDQTPEGFFTQRPDLAPPGYFTSYPDQAPEGYFDEHPEERPAEVAPVDSADPTGPRPEAEPGDAAAPVASDPSASPARPRNDAIPFESDEHAVVLSTRGASVRSLTLKKILGSTHRPVQTSEDDAKAPTPFMPLHTYLDDVHSFAVEPLGEGGKKAATEDWAHEALPDGGHRFSYPLPNGLKLTKTYLLPAPAPASDGDADPQRQLHFRLRVGIENPTGAEVKFGGYHLYGPAGMIETELGRASYGQEYVLAVHTPEGKINQELDPVAGFESTGKPDESLSGHVAYFGTATKYFTAIVVPLKGPEGLQPGDQLVEANSMGLLQFAQGRQPTDAEKEGDDPLGLQSLPRGLVPELTIPAGKTVEHDYMVYVGPRQEANIFEQPVYSNLDLDQLVYFGWGIFGTFAKLLLWVLEGLYALIGNWGLAILALTFLVRGGMLPLSVWSQKNMLRMQKLAPEINKLKEKFSKGDGTMSPEQQRQFQAAQMELWRSHNVNPVGCIGPIFLQMPIFIGLYNALNYASTLRHTEFVFWIKDLSIPDVVARLPFTLPLIGTNALSILPLLMVGTYILQQKVQPAPADEKAAEQQRIMKFVLPMFGFLFYTMPSGLMLYFMTSALWSIGEQLTIKKKIMEQEGPQKGKKDAKDDMPGLTPPESGGGKSKGKKGKKGKARK